MGRARFKHRGFAWSHTLLLLLALLFLLLPGSKTHAVDIVIPGSALLLTLPDNYTRATLEDNANILLQYDAPDGKATVQLVKWPPVASATAMAEAYEARIRQAFETWEQAGERMIPLLELPTLLRRYSASSNGEMLDVQALFCSFTSPPFVVQTISQGEDTLAGMTGILNSIRPIPAPAPVLLPTGAHTFLPPPLWRVAVNKEYNSVKLSAPEAGMWLLINASVVEMGELTLAKLVDDTIAELEANLPEGYGWQRVDDRLLTPEGAIVRLRRFAGKFNNKPLEIALMARAQDGHVFAFYGSIIPEQRERVWPMIQAVVESVRHIHAATTPAASGLPADWRLRGNGPIGWEGKTTPSLVVFSGVGEAKEVSITVQRFPLTGVHATLEASEIEALRQLRATPGARLLQQGTTTVDASPARTIEFTYVVDTQTSRMLQVLVAADDGIYWIGYSGSLTAYHASLGIFSAFVKALQWPPKPVTPSTGGDPIEAIDPSITFTLPTGWRAMQDGSITRYTPPVRAGWPGAEMTVRVLPRNADRADALTAGKTLRAGFAPDVEVLESLYGKVQGVSYSLTEYRSVTDGSFLHRRLYYLNLPNGIGEVSCQLTSTTAQERDRLWKSLQPVFDEIFDTLSPLP